MRLAGRARTRDAWQVACPAGAEPGTTRCGAGAGGQQAVVKFVMEAHLCGHR